MKLKIDNKEYGIKAEINVKNPLVQKGIFIFQGLANIIGKSAEIDYSEDDSQNKQQAEDYLNDLEKDE